MPATLTQKTVFSPEEVRDFCQRQSCGLLIIVNPNKAGIGIKTGIYQVYKANGEKALLVARHSLYEGIATLAYASESQFVVRMIDDEEENLHTIEQLHGTVNTFAKLIKRLEELRDPLKPRNLVRIIQPYPGPNPVCEVIKLPEEGEDQIQVKLICNQDGRPEYLLFNLYEEAGMLLRVVKN